MRQPNQSRPISRHQGLHRMPGIANPPPDTRSHLVGLLHAIKRGISGIKPRPFRKILCPWCLDHHGTVLLAHRQIKEPARRPAPQGNKSIPDDPHSAPLAPPGARPYAAPMILLSYNIQYGFGTDGRYDLSRAAQVMQGADIIALQEVDRQWQRTDFDDQPARLESALPSHYTAYGPAFDMDASQRIGTRVVNRRRQFGPMILSRWPIVWTRLHLLPLRRMLDPLNTQTAALEACIAAPSGPLRVFSLHLAHVGTPERLMQITHLQTILAQSAASGPPWSGTDDEPTRNWTEGQAEPPNPASVVLMGDFNCEPGSAEMTLLLGQTPYHPAARYADGLVDAAALTGAVLHSHEKIIAGQRRLRQLDHILISADLAPHLRRVWSDPNQTASDHLPLWCDLSL